MAQIHMTVCDVCQDPVRPARHYRVIASNEGAADVMEELDLCTRHSGPLDKILAARGQGTLSPSQAVSEPRRRAAGRHPTVTSIRDIEKGKASR